MSKVAFKLADGVDAIAVTLADGSSYTSSGWDGTYATSDVQKIEALRQHPGVVEVPAPDESRSSGAKKE